MTFKVPLQIGNEFQLLSQGQSADDGLKDGADSDVALADEIAVVDVSEDAHEESEMCKHLVRKSCMQKLVREGREETYWQSIRSVIPPCPGMLCPKSLMSNARLNPEAKKPPKGATREAKQAKKKR